MSTPISSNNPPGGIRQPAPAAAPPPSSAAVDQSAAEFAALLGAEPPASEPRKSSDDWSSSNDRSRAGESSSDARADSRSDDRVSRRERRGHSDDESSGDEESGQDAPLRSFGDAILEGFSKVSGEVAVEAVPVADGGGLDQVVQQICDKILVSDPGSGSREVRIVLKDSIMPGTEIRLLQDAGKLQVQFVTDNADSHTRLAQHQAALQTLLNEKLGDREVVVEVAMDAQGQDAGDGRSRQQRDAKDEYERQENG